MLRRTLARLWGSTLKVLTLSSIITLACSPRSAHVRIFHKCKLQNRNHHIVRPKSVQKVNRKSRKSEAPKKSEVRNECAENNRSSKSGQIGTAGKNGTPLSNQSVGQIALIFSFQFLVSFFRNFATRFQAR